MSRQTWMEVLAVQRAAGTLLTNYTTAKSIINPDALFTIPANYLEIGKQLSVKVAGAISNIVTTPGLMNFQVKIGSVAAFDTGNVQLNATAHTTVPFWLEILMTIQALGSGTNAKSQGQAIMTCKAITFTAAQTDDVQDMPTLLAPATTPAQGTGFDSTIANVVDLWAGFTIANAGNGVQVFQYQLAALN